MKKILILACTTLFLGSCNNTSQKNENQEVDSKKSTEIQPIVEEKTSVIITQEISYTADGITMQGFMAYPNDETSGKPGVLVVHEWWGHNEHARNKAKKLAELGYVAFAVDMYGDGKQANHPEDAGKFSGMVMKNIEGAKARFEAAMQQLASNKMVNNENIAAIGFCFGGSVAMTMANMGLNLKAVTAFHSGVQLPVMPEKGRLKTPILVLNGQNDPFVTEEQKETFKNMMDATGVDYNFIDYPGAVHAFTNPDATAMGEKFNLPLAYNQEVDEKSWNEMKAFLQKYLKG